MPPKRIMIVGLPGAGKSTFAQFLSQRLHLSCYHIDKYYWKPRWQKHSSSEWKAIHQHLIEKPQWIIEGCAIKSSFIERFARAELVIYFKLPRMVCLWRMVKRRFLGTRPDKLPTGCDEGLPWRLIKYMWTFDRLLMSYYLPAAQKNFPHVKVIIINEPAQVEALFQDLISFF